MNYELIGCPMNLGVSNDGLLESIDAFNKRYTDLKVRKIDVIPQEEDGLLNLKNLNGVIKTCNVLAQEVYEITQKNKIPICIGGDHALAMGTISGSARAHENMGVFWIDSHSDINTDESTASGNIHGMPVSAVMGYGYKGLVDIFYEGQKVKPQNIVLFGLRDVDPPEKLIIEKFNIKAYYYEEIVKRGLEACLDEATLYFKQNNVSDIHLSFDLDSMDPKIIKGVTVPVKSGFTPRAADEILKYSFEKLNIVSADIVEYNPSFDEDLYTAEYLNSAIRLVIDIVK